MNRVEILKERYQLVKELRSKAFGKTYVATDTDLPSHPQCVVKQLDFSSHDFQSLTEARRLFEKEAQTLERLGQHPQIPKLFAYFEENKKFYIVQEFVSGKTLDSEFIKGQPLPENQVINLLTEVLEILVFVHKNNAIHGNIKPDNIVRRHTDGKLVLLDLDAFKALGTQQENHKNGTPGYRPKEQEEGNPQLCSDIYAVGMIGIQACTGKRPYELAKNNQAVSWRKHAKVSSKLADAIDKMVRENWQERYQSAQEALDALKKNRLPDLSSALVYTPAVPEYIKKFGLGRAAVIAGVVAAGTALSALYVAYSLGKLEATEGTDAQLIKKSEAGLKERNYPECIKNAKIVQPGSYFYSKAQYLAKKCDEGINWQNLDVQTYKEHSDKVWSVAFSPDKKTFASGSRDQTIKIWNWPTMKLVASLEKGHSHSILSLAFTPDGRQLASGGADTRMNLWKPRTSQIIYTRWHAKPVGAVAISPDAKILATGSDDKSIKVFNLENGAQWLDYMLPGTNSAHSSSVYALAFSPDSKTLVTGSADNTMKIWDLVSRKPPQVIKGHSDAVDSLAISPDGQLLVSGSWDKTIKVWNLKTQQEIRTIQGHTGKVTSVAISPDGKTLASGSADQTIKLWDLQTGKLINTLKGHSGEVLAVAFSPDGTAVASGGADKTVKIWLR